MTQAVEKPAIVQAFETIGRHGRSRDIAAEALDDAPHLVFVRRGQRS
ncbi:MAG TPA: hypothetical protein VEO94_01390 [Candidatus Dormibacteraeota bacterium]|nr:hypothetical protein [Candidatus Dormibacteraeota bacterium]